MFQIHQGASLTWLGAFGTDVADHIKARAVRAANAPTLSALIQNSNQVIPT
jgi:hypothetical protein